MEQELEKKIRERSDLMKDYKSLLEPCPFCRSKSDDLMIIEDDSVYTVICKCCHCSGPLSNKHTVAAFLWNVAADKDVTEPIKDFEDLTESMELLAGVFCHE